MNRTVRAAALSTAVVLLLAACSGASESTDEPTDASSEVTASEVGDPGEEGGAEMDEENLVYEQGTFAAQNDTGAEFKIEIPAEAPADIEELREAVGEDPVGYIKIEIDNTNGTENAGPSDVHLVDENGNQHSYTSAFVVIGDWGPSMRDDGPEDVNDGYWYAMPDGSEITEDEYDALNTQANDLYNAHLENDAMPRAKATAYYIGPEVPEKFLYVEVQEAMVPYIAEPAA